MTDTTHAERGELRKALNPPNKYHGVCLSGHVVESMKVTVGVVFRLIDDADRLDALEKKLKTTQLELANAKMGCIHYG